MYVANPMTPPTDVYMYTLHPTRVAILTEGSTDAEKALAAQHWIYSQELLAKGIILFAGRTLDRTEESFAICVIHANAEDEARAVMEGDPAVKGGVFRARLFPYNRCSSETGRHPQCDDDYPFPEPFSVGSASFSTHLNQMRR